MTPISILAALYAPFDPDLVSWRVGSTTGDKSKGMALAYLDARDVQDRLNAVMGADWQCEYTSMQNGTCCCRIGIKIDGEWRWRSNGAGETDVEGDKGQYSAAFKRAAVLWGIGAYLYNVGSPWVALEQKGKTHVIAAGEQGKLRAALVKGAPSRQSNDAPQASPPAAQPPTTPPRQPPAEPQQPQRDPEPRASPAPAATPSGDATEHDRVVSMTTLEQMTAGLKHVTSPASLTAWERNNGAASGKWDKLVTSHKAIMKQRWQDARAQIATMEAVAA